MGRRYMEIREFVDQGYLMELNRQFLHPLGMALEITSDKDGVWLSGIWDARDDPEGIVFDEPPDGAKILRIADEMRVHHATRQALFGWAIQPPEGGVYIVNEERKRPWWKRLFS